MASKSQEAPSADNQQESGVLSAIATQNQILPTIVEFGKEHSLRINLSSVQHLNSSLARHWEKHLVCIFLFVLFVLYLSYLIIIAYFKLHDSSFSSILRNWQPISLQTWLQWFSLYSSFGNLIIHILANFKLASITFFLTLFKSAPFWINILVL